jgi:CRISPR-associated protein Csb2
MALYLNLTVRFFSGHYHGKEWPPSPARLFQALVAGAKTGDPIREWNVDQQSALEWLEGLDPPEILSRASDNGRRYTIFVPNNSLEDGHSTKTSKPIAPTILVNHSLGEPDVVYLWRISDADAARIHLAALDQLAAHLRALGWGIDFAAAVASLHEDEPSAHDRLVPFTPTARGGISLRVPKPGLLTHLDECHKAFTRRISDKGINPYTRPTRFGQARYRRASSCQPRAWIAFEMQTPNRLPFAARWDQAQTVAAWVRHAAGEALLQEEVDETWINSFVFGHTTTSDLGHRLSFVPLPSIGHQHSDGGIRRVLIVGPPGAFGRDADVLDLLKVKLSGWVLTDDRKQARAVLVPATDRTKVLPSYVDKARIWETVTPMVLHGHNSARGRISLPKTDRLLRQAFESAGYPEPMIREITFQRAPYWPGCEAAIGIRVPRHLAQWPRLQVRVEFTEDVEGPVLAGIGRHCGIGVFATSRKK